MPVPSPTTIPTIAYMTICTTPYLTPSNACTSMEIFSPVRQGILTFGYKYVIIDSVRHGVDLMNTIFSVIAVVDVE